MGHTHLLTSCNHNQPAMGTFSVSLPDDEDRLLKMEADKNERSKAAQVRVILKDWFKKNKVFAGKSEA